MIEKEKVNLSWNRETIAVKMGRDLGEKPFNFLTLQIGNVSFRCSAPRGNVVVNHGEPGFLGRTRVLPTV